MDTWRKITGMLYDSNVSKKVVKESISLYQVKLTSNEASLLDAYKKMSDEQKRIIDAIVEATKKNT